MHNFGKTANLKAQQRKQMDRDLKRRIAKQIKANIKSSKTNKDFEGLTIHAVERIEEAMQIVRGL